MCDLFSGKPALCNVSFNFLLFFQLLYDIDILGCRVILYHRLKCSRHHNLDPKLYFRYLKRVSSVFKVYATRKKDNFGSRQRVSEQEQWWRTCRFKTEMKLTRWSFDVDYVVSTNQKYLSLLNVPQLHYEPQLVVYRPLSSKGHWFDSPLESTFTPPETRW